MKTKNLLIAAVAVGALIACSSTLRAQDSTNTPPAASPGAGMKGRPDMAKQLNLTDDQKPKFQEIMKGAMEKRKALRADTTLTPEDKKAKAKTLQEETSAQMKALLTPEQFATWEKMAPGMRRGPGAGGPGSGAPPAGDKPPQN